MYAQANLACTLQFVLMPPSLPEALSKWDSGCVVFEETLQQRLFFFTPGIAHHEWEDKDKDRVIIFYVINGVK